MRLALASSEGRVGMSAAVDALRRNLPALDVIEQGICPVELDPQIRTVGIGGRPNLLGQMELDACIMDGRTLRTGAVGALRDFLHPISVARQVMEQSPHVFLVGDGAARFARECGAEEGETLTEESRTEWEAWIRKHRPDEIRARWPDGPLLDLSWLTADTKAMGGTTTLLVQDSEGNIAAGVSTSGWTYKYPGRLGDSPVIGAGAYADNRYGAAACTGMGKMTIRAGTARAVVLYMKMGMSVHEACQEAVNDLRSLKEGLEGAYSSIVTIHAIDAHGEPCVATTSTDSEDHFWHGWFWREGMDAPQSC